MAPFEASTGPMQPKLSLGYKVFLSSAHSLADDSAEEKKLRSSMSRKVRLWNEGEEEEQEEEEEEEEEEGEGKEERGGEVNGDPQLREMIKTEREQKVHTSEGLTTMSEGFIKDLQFQVPLGWCLIHFCTK